MQGCVVPRQIKGPNSPEIGVISRNYRAKNELRSVVIDLGIVNGASGSAYYQLGNTKIISSVRGPTNSNRAGTFSDLGQLDCEVRYAFEFESQNHNCANPKQLSNMLTDSLSSLIRLDRYPKAVITVSVLILESDGVDIGAIVTCGSIALADAAVELNDLVTSCTTVMIGREIYVDPDRVERGQATSSLTIATACSTGEVALVWSTGVFEPDEFKLMMRFALAGCTALRTHVSNFLSSRVTA